MKALVLALALIPTLVFADFRPGRVRVEAAADMQVLAATGLYQGVKKVKLVSLVEDGKGLVGYKLSVDGREMNFPLSKAERDTGCGAKSEAVLKEEVTVAANTVLFMNDMTNAMCERVINHIWEVKVETRPFHSSQVSTLILGGNPEHFALTL